MQQDKNSTLKIKNNTLDSGRNVKMDRMVYYLEIKKEIEELLKLQDRYFAMYQVYTDPIQRKSHQRLEIILQNNL